MKKQVMHQNLVQIEIFQEHTDIKNKDRKNRKRIVLCIRFIESFKILHPKL